MFVENAVKVVMVVHTFLCEVSWWVLISLIIVAVSAIAVSAVLWGWRVRGADTATLIFVVIAILSGFAILVTATLC
jgi:hypothetical protein